MEFTNQCLITKNNNRVILANRNSGEWIKISKQCYEIITGAIERGFTPYNLILYLENDEDKEYFKKLISILFKIRILCADSNYKEEKIKKITFAITYKCNLKCTHCCVDAKHIGEAKNTNELNTIEIKDIVKKIAEYNPDYIVFTGGEPLVRNDFIDILEYTSKVFRGKLSLSTNATLINENNIKNLINTLSQIDISIDGIDEESCAIFRGKGVFDKVINVIKRLHDYNFNNIILSMVFTDNNKHLKDEFLNLNAKLSTTPLMRMFEMVGRGFDNKDKFISTSIQNDNEYELTEGDIPELRRKTSCFTCGAGYKELMIDPTGNLYPCGNLNHERYKLGNILHIKNIANYIQSNEFVCSGGYKELNKMQPQNFELCRDCNVNLFCWKCISGLEVDIKNIEKFKNECVIRKNMLNKIIWS